MVGKGRVKWAKAVGSRGLFGLGNYNPDMTLKKWGTMKIPYSSRPSISTSDSASPMILSRLHRSTLEEARNIRESFTSSFVVAAALVNRTL
jgi:hypothetical protein